MFLFLHITYTSLILISDGREYLCQFSVSTLVLEGRVYPNIFCNFRTTTAHHDSLQYLSLPSSLKLDMSIILPVYVERAG